MEVNPGIAVAGDVSADSCFYLQVQVKLYNRNYFIRSNSLIERIEFS